MPRVDGLVVAEVRCPKCGKMVYLPSAAVRLNGILRCDCGCLFEYPCFKFYNRDGSLRPGYITRSRYTGLVEKDE